MEQCNSLLSAHVILSKILRLFKPQTPLEEGHSVAHEQWEQTQDDNAPAQVTQGALAASAQPARLCQGGAGAQESCFGAGGGLLECSVTCLLWPCKQAGPASIPVD